MKAIIQRVSEASASIECTEVARIGKGLLILLGIHKYDKSGDLLYTARKCSELRIFDDNEGKMNRSVEQVDGEILVVSEFTIYGDASRGKRPGFGDAMNYQDAERVFNDFIEILKNKGNKVQTGRFGANMAVALVNEGPATFIIDSKPCREYI